MDFTLDIRTQHGADLDKAMSTRKSRDLKKLREASQEFEAIYINEMYKAARKNIPDSGLIKKNSGQKIFEEMLHMEQTRIVSKNGSFGLADAIYKQLSGSIERRKE